MATLSASYSEKRGRGSGGTWKTTFRSLSPFPLLKRGGSTCSTPTGSEGKRGGGASESGGCCHRSSGIDSDRRRKLCCAAVAVALLLVALAVGLAVVYAGQRACGGPVETTRVLGSFRVTQGPYSQYSPELGVNTSPKFSNWSSSMAAKIDYVYSRSNISAIYIGSEVLRFRPGSVFVDFRLTFQMAGGGQPAATVDQSALRQAWLEEADYKGSLADATVYLRSSGGSIVIDADSISFTLDANPDSLSSDLAFKAANSTPRPPQKSSSASVSGACEPILVSECQSMFWNSTGTAFPNFAGYASQLQTGLQRQVSILMLLTQRCYALWNVFVCAVYVPRCGYSGRNQVPPCRHLCVDALRSCENWITSLQLEFPFNCSQFPDGQDSDTCVSSNVPPCQPKTFRCDNTSCQPLRNRCDGVIDCVDGTDEANCKNFTCTPDQFHCLNGNCRPLIWVCDQHNDCGDNSDEVGCKPNGDCSANMFRCNKGGYSLWNETTDCIPASYTCDGTRDCSDGSDEDPVYCRGRMG